MKPDTQLTRRGILTKDDTKHDDKWKNIHSERNTKSSRLCKSPLCFCLVLILLTFSIISKLTAEQAPPRVGKDVQLTLRASVDNKAVTVQKTEEKNTDSNKDKKQAPPVENNDKELTEEKNTDSKEDKKQAPPVENNDKELTEEKNTDSNEEKKQAPPVENNEQKLSKKEVVDQEILSRVSKLRRDTVAKVDPCPKRAVNCVNSGKPNGYNRDHELKAAFTCGPIPNYLNPYEWEDHIKGRLFDQIRSSDMNECTFVGLDVGGARGDWSIATGVQHNQSNMVVIEANPTLFQEMIQDFQQNLGLADRVFAYNAAIKSDSSFFGYFDAGEENNTKSQSETGWNGPTMCVEASSTQGVMITKGDKGIITKTDGCSVGEIAVPILTADVVMSDFWTNTNAIKNNDNPAISQRGGNLFFAKFDIEGAEYEALLGANSTFLSKETRPCYVYIEIKTIDPAYDKAFHLLTDTYGYTEYHDIDSGLSGAISYPPKGAKYKNEGNYEFQLPALEMEECKKRVRDHSCN